MDAAEPAMAPSTGSYTLEEVRAKGESGVYRSWDIVLPEGTAKKRGGEALALTHPELFRGLGIEGYTTASEHERKAIVDRVVAAYQSVDGIPVNYFSDESARAAVEKCWRYSRKQIEQITHSVKDSPLTRYFVASQGPRAGAELCEWMFPNLFDARSKDGESLRADFESPLKLGRHVRALLNARKGPERLTLSTLRKQGYYPRNFNPVTARAIYETYLPKQGGTVLDPSAGYGGRLLGALTSRGTVRYIGCDPNDETIYNLDRLARLIESVTGRANSFELHCSGSQHLEIEDASVDMAFTSPPYFDLEIYREGEAGGRGPTQSVTSFANLDAWFKKYVFPTAERVRDAIKPGGVFLVNLTDYQTNARDPATRRKRVTHIVDGWVEQTERAGLALVDIHYLANKARPGTLQTYRKQHKTIDGKPNVELEPILVFKRFQ